MRIAEVAPLVESVPPARYGGTERVVHYLTEELVRRGHDVTLFASGDSITSAKLVAPRARSLRLDGADLGETTLAYALMCEQLAQRAEAGEFDIVHIHCDQVMWPVLRRLDVASVTTLHGRLDLPPLLTVFDEFREMPLVSISDSQRAPAQAAAWLATVHHGLPLDLYPPGGGGGEYLAFLGRFSPEKRPDLAIAIAERAGMTLKVAAKVDPADQRYYTREVEPLLSKDCVEFVGEVGEDEKGAFLGNAAALVFPIDWPEPFGLVMIEALACGTPVIALNRGSVPEVIRHGITGYVVESVNEAVQAVECIPRISRGDCREDFERRFSVARMADGYLEAFERLLRRTAPAVTPPPPALQRLSMS